MKSVIFGFVKIVRLKIQMVICLIAIFTWNYIQRKRFINYFFFRSSWHRGQYHFPFGFVVSPTQAK